MMSPAPHRDPAGITSTPACAGGHHGRTPRAARPGPRGPRGDRPPRRRRHRPVDVHLPHEVGEQQYTFEFTVKGTTLTGTAKSNLLGENTISDGKVDGQT